MHFTYNGIVSLGMPHEISFPIRMSKALKKALDDAGKLMTPPLSGQDTARLALFIGLDDLKRCGYNLAAAIVDKATAAQAISSGKTEQPFQITRVISSAADLRKVAEESVPYGSPNLPPPPIEDTQEGKDIMHKVSKGVQREAQKRQPAPRNH